MTFELSAVIILPYNKYRRIRKMKSIKKLLAITLSLIMALGVFSASVFAEEETDVIENEIISIVDITVAAPVAGEYAVGDYEFESVDYSVDFLQWVGFETENIYFSTDPEDVITEEPFTAGDSYVVCITVEAADGFVFDVQENLIVSVNGYEAQIFDLTEDGKELSFSCLFECEAEDDIGGDDGNADGGFSFDQILNLLKSVFLTFIRFIGSLIGIS